VKKRGCFVEKQKLLSEISVQCSVVQNGIAKNFDKSDNKELLAIVLTLKGLLDSFIDGQPKT
jgi:hypothetical protein